MWSAAVLFCLASPAGCAHPTPPAAPTVVPPPTAPAAPDVTVAAADATVVAAEEPADPPPRAYADEASVTALARDPRWVMAAGDDPDDGLACDVGIRPQSCVYSPCHEGDGQRCRDGCERTCNGADVQCRGAASTCLAACVDEACRGRCARVEGACLDEAFAAKDRCLSGGCERVERACEEALGARFQRSRCPATCAVCSARCESADNADPERCWNQCFRARPGCTGEFRRLCISQGPRYGLPVDNTPSP